VEGIRGYIDTGGVPSEALVRIMMSDQLMPSAVKCKEIGRFLTAT